MLGDELLKRGTAKISYILKMTVFVFSPREGTSSFKPGPTQAALMSSLPILALLVVAPSHIYIGNPEYFDHKHFLLIHLAIVQVIITLALYVLFRTAPRLRRYIAYPLGAVGVFLCISYVLTPNALTELPHGGMGGVTESLKSTLTEATIILSLLLLVAFVRTQLLVEITTVFAALVLLIVPCFTSLQSAVADNSDSPWLSQTPAPPARSPASLDVYHLIFDGFDGTAFGRIVEQANISHLFDGFVWYPVAYSNYTSTALSFPSFMTGRVFDETITDKTAGAIGRSEGLVSALAERGMTVSQYNAYFVNNHRSAHRRISTLALEEEMYGNLRHIIQILDVSLLVIAPSVLKQKTIIEHRGVVTHLLRNTSLAVADWTRNPPLISRMLFSRLLNDLPNIPPGGNYVNVHLLIPHTPPVLNTYCEYDPTRIRNGFTLLEQSLCAVLMIGDFTNALRRLGRFENSLIIVHSDHGTLQRDRPLLLVKYPGRADAPMEQVTHPVQLVDVAPTILNALGIETTHLEGLPLREVRADTIREFKVWVATKKGG